MSLGNWSMIAGIIWLLLLAPVEIRVGVGIAAILLPFVLWALGHQCAVFPHFEECNSEISGWYMEGWSP